LGSEGEGEGEFLYPTDIAVDSTTGNVYVSDSYNHRIQVFASSK
jgi:DNA-binding beta-propeller fold protein YncE